MVIVDRGGINILDWGYVIFTTPETTKGGSAMSKDKNKGKKEKKKPKKEKK
jgi:hypothetical protein